MGLIIFIGWVEPVERDYDGGGRRGDGKVPEWVRGMSRLRCKGWPNVEAPSHCHSRGGGRAGDG